MRPKLLAILVIPALLAGGCAVQPEPTPEARAGIDRFVPAGERLTLVGSADREVDTYVWTVVSAPGPQLLAGGGSARAIFTPAEPGTYVLALEVFAGSARSEPDYVLVTAVECDRDGDGARAEGRICKGADCDDLDPTRSPRIEDICEDGIDQDCDGHDADCCPRDRDADGFVSILCPGGNDCNDTDSNIHPGAYDVCNGKDDDCNGLDDGVDCRDDSPCVDGICGCVPKLEICDNGQDEDCDGQDLKSDSDGDTYEKVPCGRCDPDPVTCRQPNSLKCCDCDDNDINVHPEATERCGNGKDDDCRGGDQAFDQDGDGYSPAICNRPGKPDCNDLDPNVNPGALDFCPDGIDQDCSGADSLGDLDGDGFLADVCAGGLDCNDLDPHVHPNAAESCNGLDDDCNGVIDDLPPASCGPAVGAFSLGSGGSVQNWLVLGPFPTKKVCWDEEQRLPEGDGAADPLPLDGAFGYRWEPVESTTGAVSLPPQGSSSTGRAAYLFTRLVVPAPAHYQLVLDTPEAAELWVDGVQLARSPSCDRSTPLTGVAYLTAGVHRVLIRTGSNGGAWNVALRLLTPRTTSPGTDRVADEVRVDNGVGSGHGSCRPGTLVCDPVYGQVCVDYVGPTPESCATPEDDDCDGLSPEPDEDGDGIPAPGCTLPGYEGPADCNDHHRQIGPGQPELCDPAGADEDCDGHANDLAPASCGAGPTSFLSASGAIGEWLVFGPVDTPGLGNEAVLDRRDLLALFGGAPESVARAYPGQVVGPFAWRRIEATGANGWVGLAQALPARDFDRTTVLAQATLWLPRSTSVVFQIEGGGALWTLLDGEPFLQMPRTTGPVSLVGTVALAAGPHRLLLKLTNVGASGAGFAVRMTAPGGASLAGVGVDVGLGVLRGACVPGLRTCGPSGWSSCQGAISAVPEKCNRRDDDCDGVLPDDELDLDGDGLAACEGDCNDSNPAVVPGGAEVCDGLDNDCDGYVDTGPGGVPLSGEQLCGVAGASCQAYWSCSPSRVRCVVSASCSSDATCVDLFGTDWRCSGGQQCYRCGAP